jgi:hypothetical protein
LAGSSILPPHFGSGVWYSGSAQGVPRARRWCLICMCRSSVAKKTLMCLKLWQSKHGCGNVAKLGMSLCVCVCVCVRVCVCVGVNFVCFHPPRRRSLFCCIGTLPRGPVCWSFKLKCLPVAACAFLFLPKTPWPHVRSQNGLVRWKASKHEIAKTNAIPLLCHTVFPSQKRGSHPWLRPRDDPTHHWPAPTAP